MASYCCCNIIPQTQELKKHKFIIIALKVRSLISVSLIKIKVSARLISSGSPREKKKKNLFPCPSQLLEATYILWFMAPSFILKVNSVVFFPFHQPLLPSFIFSLSFRYCCLSFKNNPSVPTQIIQDNLPCQYS